LSSSESTILPRRSLRRQSMPWIWLTSETPFTCTHADLIPHT
jgi:hypothetical protein